MTCIAFDQIHEGRHASHSVEEIKVIVTLTRVFRAECDDPDDDATVIALHASCPNLGTAHPNFIYAFLKNRDFRNETFSKKIWIVTLNYTSDTKEIKNDPLDTAAKITWRSEQYQKPAFKDNDGKGIVNSAGDYYDPPPDRDDSRWVATVIKNLPAVPIWLLDYQDTVNSAPFNIDGLLVDDRKAKVQNIDIGDWQYHKGGATYYTYRQVTISIAIAKDTFALEIQDQGFNKLDDSGAPKEILFSNESKPTTPVQLDGAGGVIAKPTLATAVFNTHHVYEERDFTILPLV